MDITFLKDLSQAHGVPGFEEEVIEVIKAYVGDRLIVEVDAMNNMILRRKKDQDRKDLPVVMLDAHSDEIGFMVHSIQSNGLIKFLPLGGWQAQNVAAQKVWIKNADGRYIQGVVGSKPPHFSTGAEQLIPMTDMRIDLGVSSSDEVTQLFKVEVGAPIIPVADFDVIEETGLMRGKAFDNRLGCSAVVETMLALAEAGLDIIPVGAISSQEEVGMRGAGINARKIDPDFAIIFEGTPADDTFKSPDEAQGVLKKGSQIRHFDRSMIANPKFTGAAIEMAKQENIKIQRAVREGGATNAGAIHLSNQGVPCLVLGTPVRYAHTHYGYSAIEDHDATIALAKAMLEKYQWTL